MYLCTSSACRPSCFCVVGMGIERVLQPFELKCVFLSCSQEFSSVLK